MHPLSRSLCLLATAALASAQSQPPHGHDPVTLQNVLVTAHPYARSQTEIAQPTSVLAGRQLALRQTASLGELLAGEPGVSSTWFGPGASRPIIRGLGGDRLRVLQNGIGLLDVSVTSPDHAVALDPLLIERVEVVRGPASLLYGSSAVGGVVNVISHRIHQNLPESALEGRAEGRLGSADDERSGGIVLEGAAGPIAWHVDGYRRQTKDVEIPGFAESARLREEHGDEDEDVVAGRIPNTAMTVDGGAFGLSFIGDSGYVGVAFSGHNALYGVPGGGHEHEDEGEPGAEEEHGDVRIDLRQRRLDLEGEQKLSAGTLRALRFKIGRAEYRHQELEGDEIGTVFTNEGHEGRLELLHDEIGGFTGALGVQHSRSKFNAVGEEAFLPPTRTNQWALFVFEEAPIGPVTWQVGARAEQQDIDVRDGSGRGRDEHEFSLSTAVVWPFADGWSLATSLAQTQRPPNAQELYANGPHIGTNAFEIGDETLGRETSHGLDVSLRRHAGRVTGSLTAFVNRFDGFIFEQPTGEEEDGLAVYEFVQRDARFAGIELETVFHLHKADGQMLDLTLAADLVRGREKTSDVNLPRITPPRVRAGLDWMHGPWSAGAEVHHVLEQNRTAPEEYSTGEYTLVSAYAGWRFVTAATTLDLFVRGTNLTDREARVHTSFLKDIAPLPGRGVVAGVRISF
jgi:iron complex outermembrane recepter protein